MSVLFVLVPAALSVVVAAIVAYLWAARRGQFDDMGTPALRVLHDDEPAPDEPPRSREVPLRLRARAHARVVATALAEDKPQH